MTEWVEEAARVACGCQADLVLERQHGDVLVLEKRCTEWKPGLKIKLDECVRQLPIGMQVEERGGI